MSKKNAFEILGQLANAPNQVDLLVWMKEAGNAIGYDKVLFGLEMRLPAIGPLQHVISGYSEAYQKLYQERGFLLKDPTVVHCQSSEKPLIWHENLYNAGSGELLEESRAHGLSHGLSLSVHEPGRVITMLSLGRDKPFDSEAERLQVLNMATVLANCLHVLGAKLVVPELLDELRPNLSPRERECLQFVAAGKSNWDIGRILGISEAVVAFHVKNTLKKMKVSSRMQAVAIGVVLRIID